METIDLPMPQPRPAARCPDCLQELTFSQVDGIWQSNHVCQAPTLREQGQAVLDDIARIQEQWYQDLLARLRVDLGIPAP